MLEHNHGRARRHGARGLFSILPSFALISLLGFAGCLESSSAAAPAPSPSPGPSPQVGTDLPSNGTTITAPRTVTVTGDATRADFEIDGAVVGSDESDPIQWTLVPDEYDEGSHTVAVTAFHAEGSDRFEATIIIARPAEGDPPPADVFEAMQNLQPGQWLEIPGSNMDAVKPDPVPAAGSGFGSIMSAWSGGAFDTKRDRLIIWGGGHGDYSGNEVYTFDLDTLKWERLTDPSALSTSDPNNNAQVATYPDGRPVSVHSGGYIQYVPDPVDKFVVTGMWGIWQSGAGDVSVHGIHDSFLFDFDTKEWEKVSGGVPDYASAPFTAVDANGKIWFQGGGSWGGFGSFDVAQKKWTEHSFTGEFFSAGRTAAIDTQRNKFLALGKGDLMEWDLGDPSKKHAFLNTSGADNAESAMAPGFVYHAASDRFVAWRGGSTVYTLNPETLVWTAHAATNTVTPGSQQSEGTWGRFRYSPDKNLFVVVNRVDKNVFVYRLPD